MIAPIDQPVSSVVRIAQEACAAEGVTLDEVIANRAKRKRYGTSRPWRTTFDRAVARCIAHNRRPSVCELGRVFGCNHSTIIAAGKRGRASIEAGRVAEWPDRGPMYDDGDGDVLSVDEYLSLGHTG